MEKVDFAPNPAGNKGVIVAIPLRKGIQYVVYSLSCGRGDDYFLSQGFIPDGNTLEATFNESEEKAEVEAVLGSEVCKKVEKLPKYSPIIISVAEGGAIEKGELKSILEQREKGVTKNEAGKQIVIFGTSWLPRQ